MKRTIIAAATVIAAIVIATPSMLHAKQRHHHHRYHHHYQQKRIITDDVGTKVVSRKTGASARVGAQYAEKFQAYIDDLESRGATVRFMGGIRRGHCSSGHMHPCGRALDVCQTSRGRVDHRCHLPDRGAIARIASAHGLFEGGQWCNSDYGHAQVGVSAAACGGERTFMARRHHRHRTRYASIEHERRRMSDPFYVAQRADYY